MKILNRKKMTSWGPLVAMKCFQLFTVRASFINDIFCITSAICVFYRALQQFPSVIVSLNLDLSSRSNRE